MKRWNSVAIVGVGLIGGSIGLALHQRGLAKQVVGIGRDLKKLRKSRRLGAVDLIHDDISRGVAEADLIIVCTPVQSVTTHVLQAADSCRLGTLITDVGSTKSNIVSVLKSQLPKRATFVGSHPLAGSEKAGCEHARADLFDDRVVVVTPTRDLPRQAIGTIIRFWKSLGTRVIEMSPRRHDQAIAMTSHLPHVLASALAASTHRDLLPLTAMGWFDTTRIASGDVELWKQILMDNRSHVLKSLTKFEKVLGSLRTALDSKNTRAIKRILTTGKENRDALGN